MVRFFQAGGHYLTALSTIAALSVLIAIGKVSAAVGVPVIVAAAGVVIGGTLGATVPAAVTPPKPPAAG